MKEWIPIPGTNKDVIIQLALEEFTEKGYKKVNITDLAKRANLTTGAIYHHFGSKAKLYEMIRKDVEKRIIDRMEGAASVFEEPTEAIQNALIAGMAFVVKNNFSQLISEDPPYQNNDLIVNCMYELRKNKVTIPIEVPLISAWRSILKEISVGKITYEDGKLLMKWLIK